MAKEITNSLRSSSIIRVNGPSTETITLANLSAHAAETVNSAAIKRVLWSTNGNISITRNSVPMFDLHNSGDMRLTELGYSVANNSTANIVVTITTGGMVVLEVTKDASYNVQVMQGLVG